MVQIGRKITHQVGYTDDGSPKPLYTRYHKNTIQRDLIDEGYYFDLENFEAVRPGYHQTADNYQAAELPQTSSDLETLRRDLEKFGYCLVKDALAAAQLLEFRARIDAQAAGERAAGVASYVAPDLNGISTSQFLLALANKGKCFEDAIELSSRSVAKAALLEQLLTEMLGGDYICNSAAAALAGPGGVPQALHCGQSMIPKPWPPWPYECFLGFLLDDFSAANGGTIVIPRSHQILTDAGVDKPPPLPATTNVCAPAGTALIMDGRLVHGTGANITDAIRRLIILTFHKPFVRQQEQWPLSLSREVYERASPKLLSRLGFKAWHGGLGGFEGHGEGSVAPLRNDYVPVGELRADGSNENSLEPPATTSNIHLSRGEKIRQELARMQASGQKISTD